MNRKIKSFTILVLGLLVVSIYFSALSQGALLSDQLEVTTGSYVKGKYLYTNTTHNDVLMGYLTITIEDIWNDTVSLLNMVNFNTYYEFSGSENPLGADDLDFLELTAIVFEHNRTTFLSAAKLHMGNSTYAELADVTYLDNTADMMDFDNVNVTLDDESYIYGDLDGSEPYYSEVASMMFGFAIFNGIITSYHEYTPFAINTVANVADTVNYYPTDGRVDELEPITLTDGSSVDCINVEYEDSFIFMFDDVAEVDCHYEAKTGLLIRSLEKDGLGTQFEFQPTELKIKTSFLPFPIAGFIVSIIAIGLVVVVSRKKK